MLNLPPGKVDNCSIRPFDHCPFHLSPGREWKSENLWMCGVFLNSAARCCISIWYRVLGYKFVNSIFSPGENTDWVWLTISYLNLEKSFLIRIIITSDLSYNKNYAIYQAQSFSYHSWMHIPFRRVADSCLKFDATSEWMVTL